MSSAPAAVAELDVVARREREGRRLAHPAQLHGVVLAALGRGVLGEVRDARRAGASRRPSISRSSASWRRELVAQALAPRPPRPSCRGRRGGPRPRPWRCGRARPGSPPPRCAAPGRASSAASSSATAPSAPRRARLAVTRSRSARITLRSSIRRRRAEPARAPSAKAASTASRSSPKTNARRRPVISNTRRRRRCGQISPSWPSPSRARFSRLTSAPRPDESSRVTSVRSMTSGVEAGSRRSRSVAEARRRCRCRAPRRAPRG